MCRVRQVISFVILVTFLLVAVGYVVGFGKVWHVPYLAQKVVCVGILARSGGWGGGCSVLRPTPAAELKSAKMNVFNYKIIFCFKNY